jgi:ribonuclease HII
MRAAGLHAYDDAVRRAGLGPVAGIDEAGRGACAGPLVVAAVILGDGRRARIPELDDSKELSPRVRERVAVAIEHQAVAAAVVVVPVDEVDARGVHVADLAAMRRALLQLRPRPGYVLTDGFPVVGLGVPGLAVWKGDRVSAAVAAASVLAKVTRDRLMRELADQYPSYGFDVHKGYVTPAHRAALERHGPSAAHRRSFAPVAEAEERRRHASAASAGAR